MRRTLLLFIFCGTMFLFPSASAPIYKYYDYSPVFMDYADLENSVSYKPEGRSLVDPGKIYYNAPYIYINERYKGIHIINNSDPAHPVNEAFIVAPGCMDIAVKENILYLDNSVDLVAFDLNTKKVTERIKWVFPEPISPSGDYYYRYNDQKVIVGWKRRGI